MSHESAGAQAGAGSPIPIASVPNLRDLGGWPTTDGRRVRRGRVLRSVDLSRMQDADVPGLAGLGIRTVYDLRTEVERAVAPDRPVPGVEAVVAIDVLGESIGSLAGHMSQVLANPAIAAELLGGRQARDLFLQTYRDIVTAGHARVAYRQLFVDLTTQPMPCLIHCTTGKDRTGWAAASLLLLLGVHPDDVMAEYLLTNEQLLPALGPLFARFEAAGGPPDLLRPVLGVEPAYLEAALAEMVDQFGSVEGYFEVGLGIDGPGQAALRAALLEG
jgi:protein-tyrosine phosphatase